LQPPIENGVAVEAFGRIHAKRAFALTLGRICPEKGFHFALDAAIKANLPLLVCGELFRYEAHERYFFQEIAPRLDRKRRFIGRVGFKRKRRLLAAARCLLVPSVVPETSSLVSMEALACGTPVVAFRAGALQEIIDDGKTGFLVDTVDQMADAIAAADRIDPETCRATARSRFSVKRMTAQYLKLYDRLARECRETRRREYPQGAAEVNSWPN
jgi:glycosyltransferase involved in cell wall biosynthesis